MSPSLHTPSGPTRYRAQRHLAKAVALATLVALAASACERTAEDEGPPVGPVVPPPEAVPGFVVGQVTTLPGPSARRPIEGIDPGEVGRRFRAAVVGLPTFEDEGGPGPVIDFELEVAIALGSAEPPALGTGQASAGEDDGDYAILMLGATGRGRGDARYEFELHGLYRERVEPGETPRATADRLIGSGIDDLVAGLQLEAAPRVASNAELVRLLGSDDPDVLLPAIREVHRRRLQSAAPPLRELLGSEDVEVIIAAATALGRLRDPEAVTPLTDLISREHSELKELVLPILAQIDTVAARSYLQAIADNEYEHPAIRQLARELLEQDAVTP